MSTDQRATADFDNYFSATLADKDSPRFMLSEVLRQQHRIKLSTGAYCYKDRVTGRTVYPATNLNDRAALLEVDVWSPACENCVNAVRFDDIATTLRELRHENVAIYHSSGYHADSALVFCVREKTKYGDLATLYDSLYDDLFPEEITRQIACGLKYLHSRKFYLGVLTPNNVHVAGSDQVQIGGLLEFRTLYFGGKASTQKRQDCKEVTGRRHIRTLVQTFTAPEILDWEHSDFDLNSSEGTSDMWSLGVLAAHISKTKVEKLEKEAYVRFVQSGDYKKQPHLMQSKGCPATCFMVAQKCIRPLAKDRPQSAELYGEIANRGPERNKTGNFCFPTLYRSDVNHEDETADVSSVLQGKADGISICSLKKADFNASDNWITTSLLRTLIAPRGTNHALGHKEMDLIVACMVKPHWDIASRKGEKKRRYYAVKSEAASDAISRRITKGTANVELDRLSESGELKLIIPFLDSKGFWNVCIFDRTSRNEKAFIYTPGETETNLKNQKKIEQSINSIREAFKNYYGDDRYEKIELQDCKPFVNQNKFPTTKQASESAWMMLYYLHTYVANAEPAEDFSMAAYLLRLWLANFLLASSRTWAIEEPEFNRDKRVENMLRIVPKARIQKAPSPLKSARAVPGGYENDDEDDGFEFPGTK